MSEAPASDRPLRADAVRNRARVLAAAERVFSERGLDASIAEVAREAEVGKATIFRSFPTKDDLIAAIAIARVQWAEERATIALENPDPWAGLTGLLREMAERHADDQVHADAFARASGSPDLARARAGLNTVLTQLMSRAKRQGALRADATTDDIRVLMKGIAAQLTEEQRRDVVVWRRWSELIANALRAQ